MPNVPSHALRPPRTQKREVESFISRTDGGHTTPLNLVWGAPHSIAVEFRNGSGCVALIIGCFGVARSGHVIFSVYGTRVADEWQKRSLGELLVRRLEVAALEECARLNAKSMELTLPGGECHCKVASLLMYCKCDWQIIHRSKQMTSEQLRKLLDRNIEVLEEAHAEYSRCDVEKALGQANAAVDKAMRKAIARAEVHC